MTNSQKVAAVILMVVVMIPMFMWLDDLKYQEYSELDLISKWAKFVGKNPTNFVFGAFLPFLAFMYALENSLFSKLLLYFKYRNDMQRFHNELRKRNH